MLWSVFVFNGKVVISAILANQGFFINLVESYLMFSFIWVQISLSLVITLLGF